MFDMNRTDRWGRAAMPLRLDPFFLTNPDCSQPRRFPFDTAASIVSFRITKPVNEKQRHVGQLMAVCGSSFDVSEENLNVRFWARLCEKSKTSLI